MPRLENGWAEKMRTRKITLEDGQTKSVLDWRSYFGMKAKEPPQPECKRIRIDPIQHSKIIEKKIAKKKLHSKAEGGSSCTSMLW